MNGIIKKLTDKGFGFIATNGLKDDVFFHSNALVGILFDDLHEGDGISFDIEKISSRFNAINVQRNGGFIDEKNENSNAFPFTNFRRCCIKMKDGKLEVLFELPDGTTVFPDGTEFTNGIYIYSGQNKWQNLLQQLQKLINNPQVKENELQHFFEQNPEFVLDNDFEYSIPQATIVTDDNIVWKADFVLIPKDQVKFAKVLELKLPTESIFLRSNSGHSNFSSKLYKAINQLKDYSEAFNSENVKSLFRHKYKTDIFKPDLQLLFGRRNGITSTKKFQEFQRYLNIQITDWDTYLSDLKRRFK